MANDWAEAFYDAVSHSGTEIYIQAEIPWQADLSWIDAAKEFAGQNPELRSLLEANKGELKSKLYFRILEHEATKSYSHLIDRLRDGPRVATIFAYDYQTFREKSLQTLNVSEQDVNQAPDIKNSVNEHLAESVLRTSPISDFQNRLIGLGMPNYQPALNPDEFNPSKIAKRYKNMFKHVVIVAARTQAVFGNLMELEPNPQFYPHVATQKLNELLRMDRAFDKDFEKSLTQVLAGLFEIEVGMYLFSSRRAHVREEKSEDYTGIQAGDIASGVARRIVKEHEKEVGKITGEALTAINKHFYKTFYNGIALI